MRLEAGEGGLACSLSIPGADASSIDSLVIDRKRLTSRRDGVEFIVVELAIAMELEVAIELAGWTHYLRVIVGPTPDYPDRRL